MNEREFKDALYQEFARIGKCLSSPKRLEILDILTQGPKSVEGISKLTSMSIANVSQHLQTMNQAKFRITSYNVCYTKLLRLDSSSCPGR